MPNLRGALPSPRHKAFATFPHVAEPAPAEYSKLAPVLRYWGNNQYGNCVSAEEAAAKDVDGVLISDTELIHWSGRHGWNNGATLTEVMDAMIAEGIDCSGQNYKDGPYHTVDWTDWPVLCSAIFSGQVKLAIAANQLAGPVQGRNGWTLLHAIKDRQIDHCTGLVGYGSLTYCCQQLSVSVPSGYSPAMPCVIMFTWSTYGIVSHAALRAITGEAWLRVPTTLTPGPDPSPSPGPGPGPAPLPPSPPWCHPRAASALRHFLRGLRELTGEW